MSPEDRLGRGPWTIKERVATRAIEALMSNYRDAQQAFLELIDNAVDNRIENQPLEVRVRVTKNELVVFNRGGEGLDPAGLEKFFSWGESEKTTGQIGFYGVGGKAAMGFLGRSMEVVCSARGSDSEYRVFDPEWETRREGEWKEFEPEERKAVAKEGYFRARVTNLKREVNAPALVAKLADIYRPLLLDGSVTILLNGKKVEPLEIKYAEDEANLRPQILRVQTRFGDWLELKVGILAEVQRIKPGIRCYYRGRLIEDEQFFSQPTPAQMPQISRLIGEAHLDFVPVLPNKANFIHSSPQWENAAKRIHDVLNPWIEKLAKLRIEQKSPVESYEKDIARRAKRVFEHVLATTGLITKRELPGESTGRRPPTKRVVQPKVPTGGTHRPPEAISGATAPTLDATVGETVRRWGALDRWEPVSMGAIDKRADVVQETGRQVLKINSDYPLYQVAKRVGDDALELYVNESAALKICEMVTKGKSIEDYVELVNQVLARCGEVYRGRIRESRAVRSRNK